VRAIHAVGWIAASSVLALWSLRPTPLPANVTGRGIETAPALVAEAPSVALTPSLALGASAIQPAGVSTIDWKVLRSLDYRGSGMSDTLRKLNTKKVKIPGFIVPLEDFQEVVKEFLLVPYFGACVHEPPPPPNQMVYAAMKSGSYKQSMWEPVWIEGTLRVTTYKSIYGNAGFTMTVDKITPYRRPGESP
jgi:hypothetical protein